MRLRLTYACACGNTFETLHHDNKLGECECGETIWPAEIRHVGKEELYKPSNDVKPWRPEQKAYDAFQTVAETVLPPPAPPRPVEPVPDKIEWRQTQPDLFGD